MLTKITTSTARSMPLRTDTDRWKALANRLGEADGAFVYAVRTTGVYCRPTCASRVPLRRNVVFFDSPEAARRAGFRACRRCRPDSPLMRDPRLPAMLRACRMMDKARTSPSLAELAQTTGLSPWHFQRVFKRLVGVSPKQYAIRRRIERVPAAAPQPPRPAHAVRTARQPDSFRGGNGSAATDVSRATSPRRGCGVEVGWTTIPSRLGLILVAATAKGVCFIALGSAEAELLRSLHQAFPAAGISRGGRRIEAYAKRVRRLADDLTPAPDLPLDIAGTSFQQRVWQELRRIPPGATRSYKDIARELSQESAARAVADACARNPLALVVPCHRVVRSSGELAGYRWGVQRKRDLLERERLPARTADSTGG